MSMKRGDLGAWIDNHTFQVMVALAQLYLFPQGTRRHWRTEVWEKLSQMYKLKLNNKLPSAQFILKYSWELNKQNVSSALKYAKSKEHELKPKDSEVYGEFYQIVEDYFIWLANELSQKDKLYLPEVLEELDRLGLTETPK